MAIKRLLALLTLLALSPNTFAQNCADAIKDYDEPRFSIEGSFRDIEKFAADLQRISDNSSTFSALLDEIGCRISLDDTSGLIHVIPIRLDRDIDHLPANYNPETIYIARLRSEQKSMRTYRVLPTTAVYRRVLRLGMNNIEKLPEWQKVGNNWQVSKGASWATTREAVITHEIAELWNGLLNGKFDYDVDHAFAVEIENGVRKDFGQNCERGEDEEVGQTRHISIGSNKEIWVKNGFKLDEIRYIEIGDKC